jgi:uncharacterized phosphosugar-binding protein
MSQNIKNRFFGAVDGLYAKIRETQSDKIKQAGNIIAESVAGGGCVCVYDTGHLINSELLNRAGGPVFIKRFGYGLSVDCAVRGGRDRSGINPSVEGLADYALRASGLIPGDVLIIGSVSGKTLNVIDLAVEAKKFGLKVITLSSHEYSSTLESQHSGKKHLYELGDVNIDNCAPFGDAMLDVEGIEAAFLPASGLSAAYIMWAVVADAVDALLEKGVTPGILKSVNRLPVSARTPPCFYRSRTRE